MARRRRDNILLLAGGTVLGLGILVGGAWLAFGQGQSPGQINLSVIPSEVQEGSNQSVTAQGNYTVNGQPSSAPLYMRIKHPDQNYSPISNMFGPQFNQAISTVGKPAGDYVVEVSDSLQFI